MGKLWSDGEMASKKGKEAESGKIEKLNCPFCGEEFHVNELVFAIRTDATDVPADQIYSDFLKNSFLPTGKNSERRMKLIRQWDEADVQKRDAGGVPLTVKGKFYAPVNKVATVEGTGADDLGVESAYLDIPGQMTAAVSKEEKAKDAVSTYRLCPNCHCELPEGLGVYKEILIGLYGGKRSGKTTYMAMAATYMRESFSSLGLGNVVIMAESREVLQGLYRDACSTRGNVPTVMGKPSFPIGLTVFPISKDYEPFFLIFQDIPGEAAVAGNDMLINHPFARANAFLGVIDVNMFVATAERKMIWDKDERIKKLDERKIKDAEQSARLKNEGRMLNEKLKELEKQSTAEAKAERHAIREELEELTEQLEHLANEGQKRSAELKELVRERNEKELAICTKKYSDIFGEPKFAKHMKQLRNVQLMLTKLDRWMEAAEDEKKELNYCSELVRNHTEEHKNGINTLHLRYADKQIRSLINLFPNANLTAPDGSTMLEWLAKMLEVENGQKAYTGVVSKKNMDEYIADNEFAFRDSENILDPILNICCWEKLLPVRPV